MKCFFLKYLLNRFVLIVIEREIKKQVLSKWVKACEIMKRVVLHDKDTGISTIVFYDRKLRFKPSQGA
jgi:hypothetical protein